MASGKGQYVDTNSISCVICQEIFSDPITLSCGHTFCRGCIQRCTEGNDVAKRKRSLQCPTCRQFHPITTPGDNVKGWVESVKTNFVILGVVENCNDSGETKDDICSEHQSPRRYFCCDLIICAECVLRDHESCGDSVSIESMKSRMISLLQDNKVALTQQLSKREPIMLQSKQDIDNLKSIRSEGLNNIERAFQGVIDMARERKSELEKILTRVTETRLDGLKEMVDYEEADIDTLTHHVDCIERTLTNGSNIELHDMYQKCQSGFFIALGESGAPHFSTPKEKIDLGNCFETAELVKDIISDIVGKRLAG